MVLDCQASWINIQTTALSPYGGMRLPLAIGAVPRVPSGCQTPDSGHTSPVRARVPIGLLDISIILQMPPKVTTGRRWELDVFSSRGGQLIFLPLHVCGKTFQDAMSLLSAGTSTGQSRSGESACIPVL